MRNKCNERNKRNARHFYPLKSGRFFFFLRIFSTNGTQNVPLHFVFSHRSTTLFYAINQVHNELEDRIFREDHKRNEYGSKKYYDSTMRQLLASRPCRVMRQFCVRIFTISDNTLHYLYNLAREERLELPTPGFGDQCSTD